MTISSTELLLSTLISIAAQVGGRAWFVRLYGDIDRTGAQTTLYLTCTTINSVDLAHYLVFLSKDWISVGCVTM